MQALGIAPRIEEPKIVYSSRFLFDERRVGAAAVYCSDGRFGEQMDEFLHEGLSLPRYDRVALPGGAACLGGHTVAYFDQNALQRQLRFLIDHHKLTKVVLIAHEGCAFYRDAWLGLRTLEEQQAHDLRLAAKQITAWYPQIAVENYFARKVDDRIAFENWAATSHSARL